ncbi:MAG TPA: hypothetical protein VMR95_01105 [Candidatus Binatia bacterium]|jgi:hypothetical protein|nr:hypothetical protein [Candidatus Binatia bacterium]
MKITSPSGTLLTHELTRKEFLSYGGLALLSLFGLHNFIAFFKGNVPHHNDNLANDATGGFGSRKFGV